MASYLEIQSLFNDNDLTLRTRAATVIAAGNLLAGTPTTDQISFAASVAADPSVISRQILMFVLAANKGFTIAQIQGASDDALQANVDTVIPSLVIALAGV